VAFAASKASVGEEFGIVEVPHRKRLLDAITEAFENKRREKADASLAGTLMGEFLRGLAAVTEYNDPRGLYARLPFDATLR
jgi:protease-4